MKNEWVKAKLKSWQEVRDNSPLWGASADKPDVFNVHSVTGNGHLNVYYSSIFYFGEELEIRKWNNSILYEGKYQEVGKRSQKFYKEWFEWIGEKPVIETLPEHLWDISDW